MVVLRLSRGGAKARPFYSIVATHKQNRRDGRFIERLGYYDPVAKDKSQALKIALDRVEYWKSHGAQMSEAVERLIKQFAKSQPAATQAA